MMKSKTVFFLLFIITMLSAFATVTFADNINCADELLTWYRDVNRENDTFVLTEDIYFTATTLFMREDDAPITVETGEFSIVFNPISTRFNMTVDDDSLIITGNKTVIDIKKGYFNLDGGTIAAVGENSIAVNSLGVLTVEGGRITSDGKNSVALNVDFVTKLLKGEVSSHGIDSTALKVGEYAEIAKGETKYNYDYIKITAGGDGAVAIDNRKKCKNVYLSNFFVSAEGNGALSVLSNTDVSAVYSAINGAMSFEDGKSINTYFCELSDNTYNAPQKYTVEYVEEEISFDENYPDKEFFNIFDLNEISQGKFAAPIVWNGNDGTLDTFIKGDSPLLKKIYYYELTETKNCNFESLTEWYENANENDIYTLTGDIIIDEKYSFDGKMPLTIDTGDYSIILRSYLNISNENLKITGKGDKLGVICADGKNSDIGIEMPNGGKIIADRGFAVFSNRNLSFIGMPEISSVKLFGNYISGAEISGKFESSETVLFANCDLSNMVTTSSWIYALSVVPEGNDDKERKVEYYFIDEGNIICFENEFEGSMLPKRYFVNVKIQSAGSFSLAVLVDWMKEDIEKIETDKSGSYKINGILQLLDEEQPFINIDIISKDEITILGEGTKDHRFEDTRVYFKLPEDLPLEEYKTFFELQYARGSIENGANFGTIAPNYNGNVGYFIDDIEYPKDGYGMILLDSRLNEYGLLTENEYCFRVKTRYEDEVRYSNELWFPIRPDGEDNDASLPSTSEEDDNIGGRGGGNRNGEDDENHLTITDAQIDNLIKFANVQNSFIIDNIAVILSKELLEEIGAKEFSIYVQKNSDTSFVVRLERGGKEIKNLSSKVKIQVPYIGSINTVCKAEDQSIIKNGYADDEKYIIRANKLGEFTIIEEKKSSYYDTVNHWAEDAISFVGARKIANGDGNGYFRPNDAIRENEFKKMLDSTLSENKIVFDINKTRKISRADAALMLYNAYGNNKKYEKLSFHDISKISVEYINAIEYVNEAGLMRGKGNNIFDPNAYLSRAEAAQIIQNVIQR